MGTVQSIQNTSNQRGAFIDQLDVLIRLPAFVCICAGSRIAAANRSALSILGAHSLDSVVGRKFTDYLSEDYRALGDELLPLIRDEASGLPIKLSVENGPETDLHLFSVLSDRTPPDITVLYGNDISDTLRNSKDLRQQETRYRTMLSRATGMTCETKGGVITDMNQAGQALLRAKDWTVYQDRPFCDLFHAEYFDIVKTELKSFCDETDPIPVRMRRSDGTVFDAEMTVSALDGNLRDHLLVQIHDTSIQHAAQRDLRRVNDELMQQLIQVQHQQELLKQANERLQRVAKLEAIGTFAFGLAHEMNTPIQALSSNLCFLEDGIQDAREILQLCLSEASDDGEREALPALLSRIRNLAEASHIHHTLTEVPQAIADSHSSVRHIALVVKTMRDFTNREDTEKAPIDINALIAELVDAFRCEIRDEAIVECHSSVEDVQTVGEKSELENAIRSVLDNARWALRDAGRPDGRISITIGTLGDTCVIDIADNGAGMSPEIQARAFDPFFTTREVGAGIGQGLTIAHHIVKQRHGGDIELTSTPGRGTTVRIVLPNKSPE